MEPMPPYHNPYHERQREYMPVPEYAQSASRSDKRSVSNNVIVTISIMSVICEKVYILI